jgi:mRNA interferase RelE/StbE
MTYSLAFLPSALKEWRRLDATLREQFKRKLAERLEHPDVPADRLRGHAAHYKVKLRAPGYRLVYEVEEERHRVLVITVGRRDKGRVYRAWKNRLKSPPEE